MSSPSNNNENSQPQLVLSKQVSSDICKDSVISKVPIVAAPSDSISVKSTIIRKESLKTKLMEKANSLKKPKEKQDGLSKNIEDFELEEEYSRFSIKSSLYISLAISAIFISFCIVENPVESVYRMHNTIMNTYLSTYFIHSFNNYNQ